jgi:tetratricopeptide (TPR) repeat protein
MGTRPHAFVAMPFGTKPGADGNPIDFNRVYAEYIAPALEAAGLTVFRADQEQRAGDIRTDMFQELLVADLVVADLSIDNPNVWYELGVRHALRSRGVVLVSGGKVTTAFDLYTDRKLRYSLKDGAPDPATLEDDQRKLTEMVKATMESWHGRKVSPVYNLMPHLQEPDWKSLKIGDVLEFWEQHDAWENRIELARKGGRIGDLLVLADEATVAAFRAEAWLKAGEALRKAGRFRFALEHLEQGLEIDPINLRALREKGICLQRLALASEPGHSLDRARGHYRDVLNWHPRDPETLALLGRIDKDAWTAAWRQPGRTPEHRVHRALHSALERRRCLVPSFLCDEGKAAGPDPHHARRAGSIAEGCRSIRALQPVAALYRAVMRHRQSEIHRALERRWRRWPWRHRAHVQRGQAAYGARDLDRHAHARVARAQATQGATTR